MLMTQVKDFTKKNWYFIFFHQNIISILSFNGQYLCKAYSFSQAKKLTFINHKFHTNDSSMWKKKILSECVAF